MCICFSSYFHPPNNSNTQLSVNAGRYSTSFDKRFKISDSMVLGVMPHPIVGFRLWYSSSSSWYSQRKIPPRMKKDTGEWTEAISEWPIRRFCVFFISVIRVSLCGIVYNIIYLCCQFW